MTALPVVSHKNSRRVAPLSPLSRAHARQTLGVTLFIFCQRRTLSRHRSRRKQLPCSCFSSGAPFFRHRSCWVYYRSIMRVAPNTYAGGSPRWKMAHELLGIPRECLVTPQRVAPRERGDPLRRVVPNTPILLSTAGVYFGIYFEFDGRNFS